jgi:hypothetical protein
VAKIALMALLFLETTVGAPNDTIGLINFFGYRGLDVARIRDALPVKAGSPMTKQTNPMIEKAVTRISGQQPTDVAQVCCDPTGRMLIYIGLRGETFKPFGLNSAPTGTVHLPQESVELSDRVDDAFYKAAIKGRMGEDWSQGYALSKDDPTLRTLQMQERTWALAHGPELIQVLRDSADASQREIASEFLGYAEQSPAQIAALVYASRDPDANVRNNATRALGVLVASNPKLAAEIEPETFLEMLGSGKWTDRNKAVMLLSVMTVNRDPQLLAKIRSQALAQLIEIARWDVVHAEGARLVLGRLGGIPEDKLDAMAGTTSPDAIIEAATKR